MISTEEKMKYYNLWRSGWMVFAKKNGEMMVTGSWDSSFFLANHWKLNRSYRRVGKKPP